MNLRKFIRYKLTPFLTNHPWLIQLFQLRKVWVFEYDRFYLEEDSYQNAFVKMILLVELSNKKEHKLIEKIGIEIQNNSEIYILYKRRTSPFLTKISE